MELKRVDALLLKILYFLAAGIVLCQVLGQDAFTSILFTLTFPTTLLIWLRTVRKTLVTTDILVLLIIAVAAICVLLNALFTQTVITFNYVKKLIYA